MLRRGIFRTTLLAAVIVVVSQACAKADEFYEFVSIQCVKELALFRLDRFGVWNVGDYVWEYAPRSITDRDQWDEESWQTHLRNLKTLEERTGLYVINHQYGRWDDRPIECDLGPAKISIESKKAAREDLDRKGNQRFYRGAATVRLIGKLGKVVWESPLKYERMLFSYNTAGGISYKVCETDQTCDFSDTEFIDELE